MRDDIYYIQIIIKNSTNNIIKYKYYMEMNLKILKNFYFQ